MGKVKEIKERLEVLGDLKEIMAAMKALAYAETKKLGRYSADQGRVMASLNDAASDFLSFYPLATPDYSSPVIVAIGSERGMCGNFNQTIVNAVKNELDRTNGKPTIITVGGRLMAKLEGRVAVAASVSGATFAEEVPAVISRFFDLLDRLSQESGAGFCSVKIITHQQSSDEACILAPLEGMGQDQPDYGSPPALTLAPGIFFEGFLRHYLQSMLIQAFYTSLLTENIKRIRHLDGAIDRLDKNGGDLRLRYNQARQEDITEEIEILMMAAQGEFGS